MIPVKQMWMKVHCLQGRRVLCGFCGEAYTILVEARRKVVATGVPLVSSDEKMQAALYRKAIDFMEKRDRKPDRVEGPCPRCRRYQPWMISRSRLRSISRWGGWPFALLWLFTGVPPILAEVKFLIVPLAGGALGAGIGWLLSLPKAARRGRAHPECISDEDLRSLVSHARSIQEDPVIEWYLSHHEEVPEDEILLSAGIRDGVGGGAVPPECLPEQVLANHREAAGD